MPHSSSQRQQHQGSPELAPSSIQSAQSPTSSHQASEHGSSRKISCQDIQLVQNLIERCLMLYMNRKDVVQTLQTMAKVEPGFTSLVWMKLEEQNPEFFKAYYTRLKLKMHIAIFNDLLDQQAKLLKAMGMYPTQVYHSAVQIVPTHPGTPSSRQSQVGAHPPASSDTDVDIATPGGETAENLFSFGTSAELPGMNIESNFVHHDPQGIDGLQADGDDISSRDTLSALPRNFSLSDLTADLGNNKFPRNFSLSDLTAGLGPEDFGGLGNYSSPFVSADADGTYLQSPEKDGFDEEPMLEEFVD